MSGEELIELYMQLFGEEPMKLTTVDINDPIYKEMIGYCNVMGTPLTDEIITKFFNDRYDVVYGKKSNFSQFKKPN